MKSIVKSLCVLMLGLMATTIQAQSPTPIANLDFEITSSTTTMPANYVYSASNAPNLKTQNGIKCIIISDGGGSTAPTFNGSSAPTNGKRWMAFCPDVDCEVTIGIMSNKKKFFIQSKDGEFFSHTNTANAVEEKTVTGLKAGQWYAMCGGSSQVYITKMAFKVSAPAGPVAVTGVTLDKTSASVEAGQTLQLTATVAPTNADNKNVTWSSDNTSVATVDANGLVSAISAGTANITVTTEDGSKTATCAVTVTAPAAPIPVTAIGLTDASVAIGGTKSLTVSYTPADANTGKVITSWTSSNTAVATVSNGVVTGVAAGTATITATTEGGKSASCTVTVSAIAVTGVSLNKSTTSLQIGGSETLTATVAPADATNKAVTWSSSNTAVATVNNGVITAVGAGTATVTVQTVDGNKTADCAVTVTAGPPVPSTNLTIHVPEVYQDKEIAGGYNTPVVVVDGREYEVFYINRDNSGSNLTIATSNADKAGNICDGTQTSNSAATRDGWASIKTNGTGGDTGASAQAEFQTSLRSAKLTNTSHSLEMHIKGYDEFSFYGRDNNGDASKNKMFEVYIDDVKQTRTPSTDYKIERFSITSGEHVIRITGSAGAGDNKLCSFSLRVAQEPRTKWLKGNDSTQVVLQTTTPKPVYYFTKYNSLGETRLVWDGQEATGITLSTYAQSDLGDTLVLGGTANCPVGTYTYHVISYYNGIQTSSVRGKLKVSSEITPQTETQLVAYQNEAIDDIKFRYYALSADDITLTWKDGNAPAGITGSGQNGTYLISGTPTQTGTFIYTVSVAGGNSVTDTIVIMVLDLGNNPVLYLYKNTNAQTRDGIYSYLTSNDGGKRNLIARKAKADGLRPADQYALYKWVLISEDVDADNPEILAIARGEAGLPVLSMKSFSYTPGRLDWGEPDNGSLTDEGRYITVWRGDHPIFKALNKKQGDRIQVLDTVVGKGLMPMTVNYTGTLCLATALTRNLDDYYADGYAETVLHEVPAEMHRNQKYICLPIGMEGSHYLTRDGKKLVDEAIKYILSNQSTVQLPTLAITDFRIGSYVGKIDDAENLITLDVLVQDSDAMKAAMPKITLSSPLTFAEPDKMAADGSVDFSNWYYGVQYTVSDYINKRTYDVIVRLYDPQGIENTYTPGEWVNIYDLQGRKLTTTNEDIRQMDLPAGVYIIATQNGTFKITR